MVSDVTSIGFWSLREGGWNDHQVGDVSLILSNHILTISRDNMWSLRSDGCFVMLYQTFIRGSWRFFVMVFSTGYRLLPMGIASWGLSSSQVKCFSVYMCWSFSSSIFRAHHLTDITYNLRHLKAKREEKNKDVVSEQSSIIRQNQPTSRATLRIGKTSQSTADTSTEIWFSFFFTLKTSGATHPWMLLVTRAQMFLLLELAQPCRQSQARDFFI